MKKTNKTSDKKGPLYNLLTKDVKEFNGIILSLICIGILLGAGLLSYKITNSYALFTDSIAGEKTIEVTASNCGIPNKPELSSNMIPVYYDETAEVWKKADSTNKSSTYKWYDYCEKMWANSVTVGEEIYIKNLVEKNKEISKSIPYNDYIFQLGAPIQVGTEVLVTLNIQTGSKAGIFQFDYIGVANPNTFTLKINGNTELDAVSVSTTSTTYSVQLSTNTEYKIEMIYNKPALQSMIKLMNFSFPEESNVSISDASSLFSDQTNYNYYANYSISSNGNFNLNSGADNIIGSYICLEDGSTECSVIYEVLEVSGDKIVKVNEYNTRLSNRNTYLNASPGTEIPMDAILTMQVWIPRYKYKLFNYNADGTVASDPQEIEITFEKGTATTGEITCTDSISGTDGATSETCKLKSTNEVCTDSTCNGKTYTHPAFTFGSQELTGMWVGKFEISAPIDSACYTSASKDNCNKTGITPLVKPDVKSYRWAQVGTFETNIMSMNDSGNIYGFATTDDTHMMKNQEWGAVAYLSHSKYGTCTDGTCTEININNSSSCYTGRSGGNVGGQTLLNETYPGKTLAAKTNAYGFYTYDGYLLDFIKNIKSSTKDMTKVASTTGNIYGIYDMSGGAWDFVMGNIVSKDATTMMSGENSSTNSGYTGIIYDSDNYTSYTGTYSYPENKYLDKYSFGTSNMQRIRSKLGDGIKEVKATSGDGWYSDYGYVARDWDPWFQRGGYYSNGADAGVFDSVKHDGSADSVNSARVVVLAP